MTLGSIRLTIELGLLTLPTVA